MSLWTFKKVPMSNIGGSCERFSNLAGHSSRLETLSQSVWDTHAFPSHFVDTADIFVFMRVWTKSQGVLFGPEMSFVNI